MSCKPIYADSLQHVRVRVVGDVPLGTQQVHMAFLTDTDSRPVGDDWKPAEWDIDDKHVLCLVGPGGGDIVLSPGRYYIWVRIEAGVELVVLFAGVLSVE